MRYVFFSYHKYKNVHLHNKLTQIAAERGLLTLMAWLTFIIWSFISLLKLVKNKDPSLLPLAATGVAALVGLWAAGLFEYNFADSEITTIFLYLITIPFTVGRIKKGNN